MASSEPEQIDPLALNEVIDKIQKQSDICFQEKDFDCSLKLIQSGLKLDPYNPKLLRELGTIYYEQFCDTAAEAVFQELVHLYSYEDDIKSLETIQRTMKKKYSMIGHYK